MQDNRPYLCKLIDCEVGDKFDIPNAASNPHFVDADGYLSDCYEGTCEYDEYQALFACEFKVKPFMEKLKPQPTPTPDQIEVLTALQVLGYNWIAKDGDGFIFAYLDKPRKGVCDGKCEWRPTGWRFMHMGIIPNNTRFDNLVSPDDPEPTAISDLFGAEEDTPCN